MGRYAIAVAALAALLAGAVAAVADPDPSSAVVRELEARVRTNPDDFVAYNKLTGYYLQRARATGDLAYLELADRSARASLAILPEEQNLGGLAARAQVLYATHDFAAARTAAERLVARDQSKASSQQLLGDVLLELGEYDGAARAYADMTRVGDDSVYSETRLARLAALHGHTDEAMRRYRAALASAEAEVPRSPETIAWCHLQLGDTALGAGEYEAAGRHYADAAATFPTGAFRAHAGLGRVRAARGDVPGAIMELEKAVAMMPEPSAVATLGDLYTLVGRTQDAATHYALCERIGQSVLAGGAPYNRQLAMFRADHDTRSDDAFRDAAAEYRVRRDVHGADAVAWTALKAGRLGEAQAAMQDALRLGTRDARFWYHAGMIARAAGDRTLARDHLERALALSPEFDVRQAPIARRALAEMREEAMRDAPSPAPPS